MFGRKKIKQYGYRVGRNSTWCSSKSDAQKAIKRMNKTAKSSGTQAKLIQRTTTVKQAKAENKCSGGKCHEERGVYCRKHARGAGKGMTRSHEIPNGVQPILRPDGKPF